MASFTELESYDIVIVVVVVFVSIPILLCCSRSRNKYTRHSSTTRAIDKEDTRHSSRTRAIDEEDTRHSSRTRVIDEEDTRHPSRTRAIDEQDTRHPSRTRAIDEEDNRHPSRTRVTDEEDTRHPSRTRAIDEEDTRHSSRTRVIDEEDTRHPSRTRAIDEEDTRHSSLSRPQTPLTIQMEKTGCDISAHLDISDIGVNFNKWRKPDNKWGPDEQDTMLVNLRTFDIDSESWNRATIAVDAVLSMLLQEIKNEAKCYTGLRIDGFVRQGSAREGLKVSLADEFDALLLFHIEGLSFQVRHLTDEENWKLPEFGHLAINNLTHSTAAHKYRELHKEQVFTVCSETGRVILNSRNLQEKVFKSIVMRASTSVEKRVNTPLSYKKFGFSIKKFNINPPSINIEIKLVEKDGYYDYADHLTRCSRVVLEAAVETVIDVDIVPGLEIAKDVVPDPTDWNKTMKCPRYAVLKWFTDNQPSAELYYSPPDVLWRICSSGYEKHVLDVSRGSKEECYIITALRIMKQTFRILKTTESPPRQTVTVLRSYYLKQIGFYCILFLVVINKESHISIVKNMKLSGVREALAYFLDFLEVCLEERKLPHFFHGNELLVYMFPGYPVEEKSLRYNLFMGKSWDALWQAELGFRNIKSEIKRQYCANVSTHEKFSEAFREFVQEGKYYQK